MTLRRGLLGAAAASLALAAPARADDAPATDDADLAAAHARLLARPRPRYLLPAAVATAAIGGGITWYWLDRDRQTADWDFPSLEARLTLDAWRFDSNPFPINFAWHAVDGAAYHLFARSSDLSLPVSVGYGLLTSLAWEFGAEFREYVSINDVVFTTGAGTAAGEFLHWLGRYLESAPAPRRWHPAARWTLAPIRELLNLGHDRRRAGTAPDSLGFSSDIWHRFELGAGVAVGRVDDATAAAQARRAAPTLALRARGELAALPGYLAPRTFTRTFTSGEVSSGAVDLALGDDAIALRLHADTLLAGVHWQTADHAQGLRATTLGVALGYDYRRELLGPWRERVAQTHLPGLSLTHQVRRGAVAARVRARAAVDFAGVDAPAWDVWRAAHRDLVGKTVLRNHGYTYAWGPWGQLDGELTITRPGVALTVGGELAIARYASQQGRDKVQADLTADLPQVERRVTWQAFSRVGTPDGGLFLEAAIEQQRRDSSMAEVDVASRYTRATVSIGTQR